MTISDAARGIIADVATAEIRAGRMTPEEGLLAAIFPPTAVVTWAEEKAQARTAKAEARRGGGDKRDRFYRARRVKRRDPDARERENRQQRAQRARARCRANGHDEATAQAAYDAVMGA
jgi:hypothetical protein